LLIVHDSRDAPDTDIAREPANLKARYPISDAGRIPDIRSDFLLNSFRCLVKYLIQKDICIEGFHFPHLKHRKERGHYYMCYTYVTVFVRNAANLAHILPKASRTTFT
jgi:hypothetical protein